MSRFWKIALIVVVVILVALFGLHLAHKHRAGQGYGGRQHMAQAGSAQGKKAEQPIPVTVVPAVEQNVPIYMVANGTVQAFNTATVSPQVGGLLMKLDFTEGGEVKQGQVLAEIDPRTYQAAYDEAVATKKQNEALLATARGNLKRSLPLAKQGYVSTQDLESLRNTVNQYAATVEANQAAINQARVNLGYTKVTAPISGIAGIRGSDIGNVLTTASTIVTITQVKPIYVTFTLPESSVEQVRKAQSAGKPLEVAALDSAGNKVIENDGTLKVINNQISPTTASFELKAQFPNPDEVLFPGQFVNVRLKVGTVDHGVVVPSQAVQRGPDGDYVYLLKPDNTVTMQNVTTGENVGDTEVLVSKGLTAGQKVVTEGQFRLKPGSMVEPLKPGEVPVAKVPSAPGKASAPAHKGGR
ncbi:efflux RND transporter periplasmic adaptor subunit [Dyella sp. A6]|uniref:efflux RND transporter periplasmic adaptor subunit n=1 Tax=Dyella aluminiiresistens TaxID=3069105 RepID=UPI002E79BD3C|nr:efflux RND transporter periplasmic adaptor subunit [Dyella sp. A6]